MLPPLAGGEGARSRGAIKALQKGTSGRALRPGVARPKRAAHSHLRCDSAKVPAAKPPDARRPRAPTGWGRVQRSAKPPRRKGGEGGLGPSRSGRGRSHRSALASVSRRAVLLVDRAAAWRPWPAFTLAARPPNRGALKPQLSELGVCRSSAP